MKSISLDELYKQNINDIYRYLFSLCRDHHLAEELLQETFLRAYLYLEHYDGEEVRPWLFKVAYNVFIDSTRKTNRIEIKENKFFEIQATGDSIEEQVIFSEALQELASDLKSLSDRERYAILLHEEYQLPYQEAADRMGIRLSNYKILLYRARQKLRNLRNERNDRDE